MNNYKKYNLFFVVMYLQKVSTFAPLPIRIMAGVAFIFHGLPKFENLQGTQGFFASVGIPAELAMIIGSIRGNRWNIINCWISYKDNFNSLYYRNDLCCSNSQIR